MSGEDSISLENRWLRLDLKIEDAMGSFRLYEKISKRVLADRYLYRSANTDYVKPSFIGWGIENSEDGAKALLKGTFREVELEHSFRVHRFQPWIEEELSLRNISDGSVKMPEFACGFAKEVDEEMKEWHFVAIPFRRELSGRKGDYMDFTPESILSDRSWFWFWSWGEEPRKMFTRAHGSEGWAITNGERSLLVLKYSNDGVEHSILEAVDGSAIRFGGCGIWQLGDPENGVELQSGKMVMFGLTRYELVDGGWKDAYYAFRRFMEGCGHGLPDSYNPPIHWNELYDNPLWWGPDTPERRKEHYKLGDMLVEALKARELGCEALYLDPGWDTSFASSIWSEERLGRLEEFLKLLNEEYGLKLALHTPLAGWSDIGAYAKEARRMDEGGERLESLCMGAKQYILEKASRLYKLCDAGVAFLMFDGTWYTGPCFDRGHGHQIPYTREAHCRAILKLAKMVKGSCPNVLIELHDPIVSGVPIRYAPIYYLHGPGSFDEVWAFEYMWDPMQDLLSGRAVSLYYYNLAYSLPLYVHIDLRKDNDQALEFWWYASTCRHLGVGGRHENQRVWEAHKESMKIYKELKRFYAEGTFYGLDEEAHAHALPKDRKAVMNLFNLKEESIVKKISFAPEEIGFSPETNLDVMGGSFEKCGSRIFVTVELPAMGHRLVILKAC